MIVLDSLRQTWPPFVLVAGLLLVGQVADADGLLEGLGARIARARVPPVALLVASLSLVAAVTAVLNLDTAVVFLTPVLVHSARRRAVDERPYLYGTVFVSNSASLLLPGSNLTNVLILGGVHTSGLAFAEWMLLPWLVACVVTIAIVALAFPPHAGAQDHSAPPSLRLGIGAVSAVTAAGFVVVLPNPAPAVLATGLVAVLLRRLRPQFDTRFLVPLFVFTVAMGAIAHAWDGPGRLLEHTGRWSTAAVAGLTANLVSNLPAAALLSAHGPAHPQALLFGLNLGPNLFVSGSLSAYLWLKAAKTVHLRPSIRTYARLGLVLVPLTLAATLVTPSPR